LLRLTRSRRDPPAREGDFTAATPWEPGSNIASLPSFGTAELKENAVARSHTITGWARSPIAGLKTGLELQQLWCAVPGLNQSRLR
jgi:hypothetical protein